MSCSSTRVARVTRVIRASLVLGASLGAAAIVVVPREAQASTSVADPERATPPRRDEHRRYVSVTVNPLALLVARYGGNLEVVPMRHHAIIGSGYLQTFPSALLRDITGRPELADNTPTAFGGELGYRYYTGRNGAEGLFIGPSAVLMPLAYPRVASSAFTRLIATRTTDLDKVLDGSVELVPFYAFGAALDIGAQAVTRSGFTIGGGVGVTVLSYEVPSDVNRLPISIQVPHVLPRLLFSAGWSF